MVRSAAAPAAIFVDGAFQAIGGRNSAMIHWVAATRVLRAGGIASDRRCRFPVRTPPLSRLARATAHDKPSEGPGRRLAQATPLRAAVTRAGIPGLQPATSDRCAIRWRHERLAATLYRLNGSRGVTKARVGNLDTLCVGVPYR